MNREISLNKRERQAANDWHGGIGSMLYAVASTGALRLGRAVHGMTEAEQWLDITDRLMREARKDAEEAKRRGLKGDSAALSSIARKAEEAAKLAQMEVAQAERSVDDDGDDIESHRGHGGTCGLVACTAAHERDLSERETRGLTPVEIERDVTRVSGGRSSRRAGKGR